jgi:putative addiction module CopG family antidote
MEITLTPKLERFVQERVRSGEYSSPDDVISAALHLFHCRERHLAWLRRMIQEGIDDLEAGRHAPAEEVFARLRAERAGRIETLQQELDPAIAEFEHGEIILGPLAVQQAMTAFRRLAGRVPRDRARDGA